MGSRSDRAIRWEHRAGRRLRHSRTKLRSRQHDRSSRHCDTIGRYDSDSPRFHITECDLSKHDGPRLYFTQRDAGFDSTWLHSQHNRSRIDLAGRNAGCSDSRFDISEWHAEYDVPRIDIAKPSAGNHYDAGTYLTERYAEYDEPRNHTTRNHTTWNDNPWHNCSWSNATANHAAR